MRPVLLSLSLPLLLAVAARADDETLNLPPVHLARGLPPHGRCRQALAEVERWLGWARDYWEATGRHAPEWEHLQAQHWTWERAARATDPRGGDGERRRALAELVEWLGWRVVLTGELPPPVPLDWYPTSR
jgi:hypothetical protein